MIRRTFPLAALACLLLSAGTAAQPARNRSHAVPASPLSAEGRKAANDALARLRLLRDGWNDVNRQFIRPDYTAGGKLDPREYEVQYLEAKTAVGGALRVLPAGELRTAFEQAMGLFDDLEEITTIFTKRSPLTTNVRVADVYPYLKKYDVPYEGGITKASSGLVLHQDFVMSYILPLRYERVNRVGVLLGGKGDAVPPPPTFEQMFRVPPAPAHPNVGVEELKIIARAAVEARLRGDCARMATLLDDGFLFFGPREVELNREQYLARMASDPSVKSFKFEGPELSFVRQAPVLTVTTRYESHEGKYRSFKNVFTFVSRPSRWRIITWRWFRAG